MSVNDAAGLSLTISPSVHPVFGVTYVSGLYPSPANQPLKLTRAYTSHCGRAPVGARSLTASGWRDRARGEGVGKIAQPAPACPKRRGRRAKSTRV